jgi:hypothetical protein
LLYHHNFVLQNNRYNDNYYSRCYRQSIADVIGKVVNKPHF